MNRSLAFAFALALAPACMASSADDADRQTAALDQATTPSAPRAVDWPTPEGWTAETIDFPIFFATKLPYEGTAEVRFAPGWGDIYDVRYFSYSFVWDLEGSPRFSSEQLSADLRVYFAGLAQRFDSAHFDPSAHSATFGEAKDGHFHGVVNTVDPFHQSRSIVLNGDIEVIACGNRQLIVFTFSPEPISSATWEQLIEQRRTLRCRK